MKRKLIILFFALGGILVSCNSLDLNPLSQGSSENWYSNESEIQMAVSNLFNIDYWGVELTRINTNTPVADGYSQEWTDTYSDDWSARASISDIASATLNSQSAKVTMTWKYAYKCIAAANRILASLNKATSQVSTTKLEQFAANARFARASQYAKLIFLYGDVPYYTGTLTIDEGFAMSRTAKAAILDSIYVDYDYAIAHLPTAYSKSDYQYASKGAALAMKARIALYMGDWAKARDAAKACIDLSVYSLHPDYRNLFLPTTKQSAEVIFANPRSVALGVIIPKGGRSKEPLTRIVGGFGNGGPSWELLCSYLCTDGLPIDKSPLYNPHLPFKNRDPRCTATIVEFQTKWLGFMYQPHPDSLTVLNFNTGKYVNNADSRGYGQYAQYNGLVWKKKIDESWIDLEADPDNIVIRYADVLLIYAEAKIELGEIDQTVLDAMNKVRSRAYGVSFTQTSSYPAITSTDQTQLRKTLRIERRMEFAFEGLRYADLIRWKLAEKVLNKPIYGMLDVAALREKIVKPGLWFFPQIAPVDEDGVPDFSAMYNAGLIQLLYQRQFDATKQYLWPIPSNEIKINTNIKQNPGY